MNKWADYLISEVSYENMENTRFIKKVKIHKDLGDRIGEAGIELREKVVEYLDSGKEIMTILNKNGEWSRGKQVHVITIKKKKFIRTDPNEKEEDNLEELPEF
ncbi:DUF3892 domain-containing protein [bacterium]|nr:DUF3892 domain-containing protein [bacterium]